MSRGPSSTEYVMKKRKIIVVDENDEIIGHKEFEALRKEDVYRSSILWITNSGGDILIAKRHRSKAHNPLKWGPSVSGTLEEGETYYGNAVKEVGEELGLENIMPKLGPKTKMEVDHNFFAQLYFLQIDKDISEFKIQEDEVEEVRWISKKDLRRELKERPENFTPGMVQVYGKMFLG